jgi:uncharacterized RDD family membrane protein YckC
MQCWNCGTANGEKRTRCLACDQPLIEAGSVPPSAPETAVPVGEIVYGSFSQRLAALIVDGIAVLGIQLMVLAVADALLTGIASANAISSWGHHVNSGKFVISAGRTLLLILPAVAYFVLMESGEHGATLGKRTLKLRVVDIAGNRVSRQRALGRCLARLLSTLPVFLGYLMQPYTRHKQALHDMVAGTLVVQAEKSNNRRAAAIIVATVLAVLALLGAATWVLFSLLKGALRG